MGEAVDDVQRRVASHYNRLDRYYRQIWGDHVHHGLWWDSDFSVDEAVRHLVEHVARAAEIEAGDRVCDVGCGYGASARLWAERFGADVVGFTVSKAQYEYAVRQSANGPAPEYRLEDFLSNGLPDGSADAVVAIESLAHIQDQPGVFEEAARLLLTGGRLVVCAWMAAPSPPNWAERYLLGPICEEGRLTALPTAGQLHGWATEAGFGIEQLDDFTPLVRRTWTVVLSRILGALVTDVDVIQILLDSSEPDRVFARTVPRIWLAQHLGVLRYGWLVAKRR